MKECSKSIARRLSEPDFVNRFFVGRGLDIGGAPDPLGLYQELFCRMEDVRTWDLVDGNAQFLEGVPDEEYDFVHSSHCLEHLHEPLVGFGNWFRVLRPGGHLVITVPDEDLYEQGRFPSTFNKDHKWTFTIFKMKSWSQRSLNVLDLVRHLGPAAEPVKIEQLISTYRFNLPRYDQTLSTVGECGIEMIIRKRPVGEIEAGGRWQRSTSQPSKEMRIHFNQYRDDLDTLKHFNQEKPPFHNDQPL
jgi:SAM-dependent methyltransferase